MRRAFAPDGPLAAVLAGWNERPAQLEMALAVLQAIESNGVLLAEAGTGMGKTFAYLVPVLLAGGKALVSTGTKTLQDQLYGRDLPAVREALALGTRVALLKGRENYICLERLERTRARRSEGDARQAEELRAIAHFARTTRTGDRAELGAIADDSAAWAHATATRENCLGGQCPRYDDCFVFRARRAALAADVVVVNHHLFFADLALRDEGVAELLPSCQTVVFDEAHQLPETARAFFGESLGSGALAQLGADARAELAAAGGASPELEAAARSLEQAARALRLALPEEPGRRSWAEALRGQAFAQALGRLSEALGACVRALAAQAERSEGLAACSRRAQAAEALLARLAEGEQEDEAVRWIEAHARSVTLHHTPLAAGEALGREIDSRPRAWILTSATLAVAGDFSHLRRELGIARAAERSWPSPFDYAHQALLYLPEGLPENPNEAGYTDAVVEALVPVLEASRGRAFLLFNSHRALRRAVERLRGRLPYPLLVQGEGSRSELLERFRACGNAVLLGTASFREGVDVRGEALTVVAMDRLPFAPPDDPVLSARIERLRAQGANPFLEVQLPQAILALRQGAGRLIRDAADRGVFVLCDPRVHTQSYGRQVLDALPPMRRTRDLAEVRAFLATIDR